MEQNRFKNRIKRGIAIWLGFCLVLGNGSVVVSAQSESENTEINQKENTEENKEKGTEEKTGPFSDTTLVQAPSALLMVADQEKPCQHYQNHDVDPDF